MAEPKTEPTDASVEEFLAAIPDPQRQADARALCALMADATGQPPVMWGAAIVGFGRFSYAYASGRTGEWMAVGFAARKANSTVYVMDGFEGYSELLGALGPHSTGRSCLYIKRLADVDQDVLANLVSRSYAHTTRS